MRVPRPDEKIDVMWCGGQLSKNTELADQAWRRFIDTLTSVAPHAPHAPHGPHGPHS